MNICKYCHNKGMNIKEYELFASNIKTIALTIKSTLKYNNGIYHNTSDIIHYNADKDLKCFIIQELKKLDIEFIENYTLYRVTD